MIARLTGTLTKMMPPALIIDTASGVGYRVECSMNTIKDLPGLGEGFSLWIHEVIKEDSHNLYGFMTDEEMTAFRELTAVTGIGPKSALNLLSTMTVTQIAAAIADGNIKHFTAAPGIGQKTAERLITELKGKTFCGEQISGLTPEQNEVLQGLVSLGYPSKEARPLVAKLPAMIDTRIGLQTCLQQMNTKRSG